jgi:hypothetical protein
MMFLLRTADRTLTLDLLAIDNKNSPPVLLLMSIGKAEILEGAKAFISKRKVKNVILKIHNNGDSIQESLRVLQAVDYTLQGWWNDFDTVVQNPDQDLRKLNSVTLWWTAPSLASLNGVNHEL